MQGQRGKTIRSDKENGGSDHHMKGASHHRGGENAGQFRPRCPSFDEASVVFSASAPCLEPTAPSKPNMVFYGRIYAYPIVTLPDISQLILTLNDEDPDDNTITIPGVFRGQTTLSAIAFHRALNHERHDVHPTFLIIIDAQDVSERGVLVLNLDYFDMIDAVRMPAEEAGISVCSLSVDNTTWQETRESCNSQSPPFSAAKQFLLYGLNTDSNNIKVACRGMNDGIGALNEPEGFAEHRSIYVEGSLETDLDEIKARHGQVAREIGCSEIMFAVVDSNYDDDGVLLLKLDEGSDAGIKQKLLPFAGEVLNWVYLGLWDWHEAFLALRPN
jgi:hypothetical protein